METKRGTVTAVTFKKSGQGQKGPYHIFTVTFDNGDSGDYISNANPQTAFVQGQAVDYTKEVKVNGQYTNTSIKTLQSSNGGFKGSNPVQINKRTALECAVEHLKGTKVSPEQVFKLADQFNAWLNSGAPQAEQPKQEVKNEAPPINEVPDWLR